MVCHVSGIRGNQKQEGVYHIQQGLGQVAVQLGKAVGELGDIDGDELIGVLDAVVECRDAVKGQLRQVLVVDVLRQSCPVPQREFGLVVREL